MSKSQDFNMGAQRREEKIKKLRVFVPSRLRVSYLIYTQVIEDLPSVFIIIIKIDRSPWHKNGINSV